MFTKKIANASQLIINHTRLEMLLTGLNYLIRPSLAHSLFGLALPVDFLAQPIFLLKFWAHPVLLTLH